MDCGDESEWTTDPHLISTGCYDQSEMGSVPDYYETSFSSGGDGSVTVTYRVREWHTGTCVDITCEAPDPPSSKMQTLAIQECRDHLSPCKNNWPTVTVSMNWSGSPATYDWAGHTWEPGDVRDLCPSSYSETHTTVTMTWTPYTTYYYTDSELWDRDELRMSAGVFLGEYTWWNAGVDAQGDLIGGTQWSMRVGGMGSFNGTNLSDYSPTTNNTTQTSQITGWHFGFCETTDGIEINWSRGSYW